MRSNLYDQLNNMMIGFDHLFNRPHNNYPPYNIIRTTDGYVLAIGCAGFSRKELSVELDNNELVITGKKSTETSDTDFVYRGLAARDWTHRFTLDPTVEVVGVAYTDGVLKVNLTTHANHHTKKLLEIN